LLAVLALLLSAFAPAAAPCAQDETPAPMPCHEGMPGHDQPPPEQPGPPAPAGTVMTCCNGGAATVAPTVRAGIDLDVVAAVVLPTFLRPAATPNPAPVPGASPPRGHPVPLSILYGCFLN